MKFNRKEAPTKTVNKAGGEAYKATDKYELVSLMLTSFVSDKFYEKADEQMNRLSDVITRLSDKQFAAKAAIYARTHFGMRSITHVAAGEIAKAIKGEKWTKNFFDKIVFRPDDATEIASYYGQKYGKPFPNAMKKGLAKALERFDSYKLAKYRGEGKNMSLVDLVNIVHPKPTEALTALVKGTLRSTQTWETKLTQAGQVAKTDEEKDTLKSKAWGDLISEGKLGYLALLRNLRNIMEQAPESLDAALVMLQDEARIKKSLVLPFQFLKADEEIAKLNDANARRVRQALSTTVDKSLSNVPELPGKTLIALDCSGSMFGGYGSAQVFEIGALFASVLYKRNNADVMLFADDATYVTPNPSNAISGVMNELRQAVKQGGTNFKSIFSTANVAYDRIIILSDMQGWIGYDAPTAELNLYKERVGCNPHIYSVDLAGYGTLQLPQDRVYCLAGFSEKIFDTMKLLEQDKQALIHEIEQIEL